MIFSKILVPAVAGMVKIDFGIAFEYLVCKLRPVMQQVLFQDGIL